jgi:hypothetical protein
MNILLAFVIMLLFPFVSLAQSDNKSDAINHLRAFTLATSKDAVLGGKAAMLLGLVETPRGVPTRQVSVALTDDIRFFAVSTIQDSDDIILAIRQDEVMRIMYLTSSKLLLRAAVVNEDDAPHLMSNGEAAAGFEALLVFWAEKGKSLQAGHQGSHVH